jgi:hypothetical protein
MLRLIDIRLVCSSMNYMFARWARVVQLLSFMVAVGVCGVILAGCGDAARSQSAVQSVVAGSGTSMTHRTEANPSPGCTGGVGATVCHVLFIGNSYTYVNGLPAMVTALAKAAHVSVEPGTLAEGGETLADHSGSPETVAALNLAKWNVVVLQEQSQLPSVERYRQTDMYPAARQLVHMVRDIGAQPMFYLTPARKDGWPEQGLDGYASMQSAIGEGYLVIARELHATVAPVGYAWAVALRRAVGSGLWQSDGSHPTVEGTYLAACVFYATIFLKSPKGLRYHAGLPGNEAMKLQAIASDIVLGDPMRWGHR